MHLILAILHRVGGPRGRTGGVSMDKPTVICTRIALDPRRHGHLYPGQPVFEISPHQSRESVAFRTITLRRPRCRRWKTSRVIRSPHGPHSVPSSSVVQTSRADDPAFAVSRCRSRRSRSRRIAFGLNSSKAQVKIACLECPHVTVDQFREFARFAQCEVPFGYCSGDGRHCSGCVGWRLQERQPETHGPLSAPR